MKSEIHNKGFAGRFALKERLRGLRVWHMYCTPICEEIMVSFLRSKVNSDSQFLSFNCFFRELQLLNKFYSFQKLTLAVV